MSSSRIANTVYRELLVLQDETNPRGSQVDTVYPPTVLDQVFDQQSPTHRTLRQILNDLEYEIATGGKGNILFPVDSVNGMTGDVVLQKKHVGLSNVDNTADVDKPLSGPQREAVIHLMENFDFHIDTSQYDEHIKANNNPHNVTPEQINQNNALETFVRHYVAEHNISTENTVHADIRASLGRLWMLANTLNSTVEETVTGATGALSGHLSDEDAHKAIFNTKEDVDNKITAFDDTHGNDNKSYPSTKAVSTYVKNKISELRDEITSIISSLPEVDPISDDDIIACLNRILSESPPLVDLVSTAGISWKELITLSWAAVEAKIEHGDINPSAISPTIKQMLELLDRYYTKEEFESLSIIKDIKFLRGTQDGTFRFYINDDISTMSEDVHIAGLQRLAYLEWITEDHIADNAVHSRHILNNAIQRRHLSDRLIQDHNIECTYGTIIGNTADAAHNTANEISLQEFADVIRPLIGGWPDPTVPGGNPWYDKLSQAIIHPHTMVPEEEYNLGDYSYCVRFKGKISCIPNMDHYVRISENLTTLNGYKLVDAGGCWMYQSDPESWAILGGSNITGHTFATITMDDRGLQFESISIGDRLNAPYDVWVRYVKTAEIEELPGGEDGSLTIPPPTGFNVLSKEEIEASVNRAFGS